MSATISECGNYRYRLERVVAPLRLTRPVLFIGINPSTADATVDDQTIRKEIGFVSRWGHSSFLKGNVFAYRSTEVRALADTHDPVGPMNYAHLRQMIEDCAFVVPCWGRTDKVPPRLRNQFHVVRSMLKLCDKRILIFGLTQGGDPLHPLMLSYETQLKEWSKL